MRKNGKSTLRGRNKIHRNSLAPQKRVSTQKRTRVLLGRYIVADSAICHGKPTFRGTRIMVWQVLSMVAKGLAWETIVELCHNSITENAIAEAVKLSSEAFLKHANEFVVERVAA